MPPAKLTIDPPQAASPAGLAQSSQARPGAAEGSKSPVAPAFSPITPKAQPVLPATYPLPDETHPYLSHGANTSQQTDQPRATVASANEYIPQPPPRPFSSKDSADAAALRAAISTLQFQKKKAQEDIQTLEGIKNRAIEDPDHFKTELAAGRLKEQRPKMGDLQAILNASDSDEEMEDAPSEGDEQPPAFERIPGPQDVVRMPNINWEKYHINGEALDRIHEQQRKWPGGGFGYGQAKGREFAVAAPYSPWHDSLDTQRARRTDSLAPPGSVITPVTSEHPMETRRGGRH